MLPSLSDLGTGRISRYVGPSWFAIQETIKKNRELFLNELRSGKYKKGTTKSDEKGKPVFEKPGDEDGYCACAIMLHLFDPTSITSMTKAREALGLTAAECKFIQQDINDSDLDFIGIANRIEKEVFKVH